ncbi:four-carbon acid sugar kinase family protein [Nonomuraea angiospora]|uniref:four-carbon acid sugar kinase family protein n=1 Tax=Nonomuraea angiospora TaxID=46172 RepID=UPI0029A2B1CB|nr:four-carbon acid sugar kinase family protein [Nonomuraea angiospora]MDX3100296.1 four-carbon acid sugar kinase family protein [Nonomuraea angiospora]
MFGTSAMGIADDATGATDVAVALRRRGIRTVLFFGLPPHGSALHLRRRRVLHGRGSTRGTRCPR